MSDTDGPRDKFIFDDLKSLLDTEYYKFLLILLKNIFLKPNNKTTKSLDSSTKLREYIEIINEKFFDDNENSKLSTEYSLKNLKNILNFVKTQNRLYASEIVENLLIIIFSFAFKTRKENTFGKYIYNNIQRLREKKNDEFSKWFIPDKFNVEFHNENDIRNLLNNDAFVEDKERSFFQKNNILMNFLLELHKEKYSSEKYKANQNFINL